MFITQPTVLSTLTKYACLLSNERSIRIWFAGLMLITVREIIVAFGVSPDTLKTSLWRNVLRTYWCAQNVCNAACVNNHCLLLSAMQHDRPLLLSFSSNHRVTHEVVGARLLILCNILTVNFFVLHWASCCWGKIGLCAFVKYIIRLPNELNISV